MTVSSTDPKSLPKASKGRRYKRPLDLAILVLAHLTLLPLWILLWTLIPLLVWLGDQGPIFFRQQRAGKDGKSFTILKFRTMVPDSDRKGPAWTTDGDLRVTAVGKFLRRTALDELPGLLSIWKGDMSLVGPRALDVVEQQVLEQEIPGFEARLQVVPGLTGLAQVHDKLDIASDKFRYDLEYIERMSFWLDVNLLLLSVRNTFLARWDRRAGKQSGSSAPPAKFSDHVSDTVSQEISERSPERPMQGTPHQKPPRQDKSNTFR